VARSDNESNAASLTATASSNAVVRLRSVLAGQVTVLLRAHRHARQVRELRDVNHALTAERDQLAGEVDELTETLRGAYRERDEFQTRVNELTAANNSLTGVRNELTGEVNELTGEVNELTGKVNELTGKVNELTGRLNELIGERHRLNALLYELTGELKIFNVIPRHERRR
jgi:chromosome segregation ATPase